MWGDVKVSEKYRELNRLGVPAGYNDFATRGNTDNISGVSRDFEIARRVSGCDAPNMLVYGGGKGAKEFCAKHGRYRVVTPQDITIKSQLFL